MTKQHVKEKYGIDVSEEGIALRIKDPEIGESRNEFQIKRNEKFSITVTAKYYRALLNAVCAHAGRGESGEWFVTARVSPEDETDPGLEQPVQLPLQFSAALALKRFGTALQSRDSGDGSDIRNRGIVLHEYFSQIADAEDIVKIEDPEVRDLIAGKLAFVEKYGWFSKEYEVYRECEIIASDGSVHRPDRVVAKDGEAVVIDYKFGEYRPRDPRYVRQVNSYMKLLSDMGFRNVRCASLFPRDINRVTP